MADQIERISGSRAKSIIHEMAYESIDVAIVIGRR